MKNNFSKLSSKIQELINRNLIKKISVDFNQIQKVLNRAYKDLKSAKLLLDNQDYETAYQVSYTAMLRAGRALMFAYGFRPRSIGSHKIVIDFAEKVLGIEYKILLAKFDNLIK